MVEGLFDSRDMEPRVRFGGLDDGCVRDEEEDVDMDRFSSEAPDPPPPPLPSPALLLLLEGFVFCEEDPAFDCPDVPLVDVRLLLWPVCFSWLPVAVVPVAAVEDVEEVVEAVETEPPEAGAAVEEAPVGLSTLLVSLAPGASPAFFLCCSNVLNSASGSENSSLLFGKGSGSISSRAAKLYMVLRCVQIASVVISRLSALDKRSAIQAMKKNLFMPTGFSPSSAKNNWISVSGLHSSPSTRSLAVAVDDMVIVSHTKNFLESSWKRQTLLQDRLFLFFHH